MQLASVDDKYRRDCETARKKAKKFWKKAQSFAPVAPDPKTIEALKNEHHTVSKLFQILATMALSGRSDYLRKDGTVHGTRVIVDKPGGRRWDQRSMAATANMAVGTIQKALRRLRELGLVFLETSRKWGTFVLIHNFERFSNPRLWRSVVGPPKPSQNSGVSVDDTFTSVPQVNQFITSTVDVPDPQNKVDPSLLGRVKAFVKGFKETGRPVVPDWAV